MKNTLLAIATFLAASVAFAADDGATTYNKACVTCHAAAVSLALKSPPAHDEAAWKTRLDTAKAEAAKDPSKFKDEYAYLINSVRNGKGAMSPGGLCVDESTADKKCTDETYLAAIKFMMSKEAK